MTLYNSTRKLSLLKYKTNREDRLQYTFIHVLVILLAGIVPVLCQHDSFPAYTRVSSNKN
jgi:hypothetical protein